MHLILISLTALAIPLAAANPARRAADITSADPADLTGIMTIQTSVPTPTPSPTGKPLKELTPCCCCMAEWPFTFDEPQPELPESDYKGECSKTGVRDVCDDHYTGESGYTMDGLQGDPQAISEMCSSVRCGPMKFVDP